ncbi:hypothetical protein MRX96_056638 [Rhipicephalus microplus]
MHDGGCWPPESPVATTALAAKKGGKQPKLTRGPVRARISSARAEYDEGLLRSPLQRRPRLLPTASKQALRSRHESIEPGARAEQASAVKRACRLLRCYEALPLGSDVGGSA